MELSELKLKLENSSLMDTVSGTILSFTDILQKDNELSGIAAIEYETPTPELLLESPFIIQKGESNFILRTAIFSGEMEVINMVVNKFVVEFREITNPSALSFTFVINTN